MTEWRPIRARRALVPGRLWPILRSNPQCTASYRQHPLNPPLGHVAEPEMQPHCAGHHSAVPRVAKGASMTDHIRDRLTYAQAGVDIDAGNRMVDLIKPLVRATARAGADAEIGGFGGVFDLRRGGLSCPRLGAASGRRGPQGKI